jgi:hypothetical protein
MRDKLKSAGRNDQARAELLFGVQMSKYVFALTAEDRTFPRSLSDLGDRSEQGGRASTEFADIEAHSGSMQRDTGGERSEGVMGHSPASAVDQS